MNNWLYQDKLDICSIYKFGRFIFIQNSIVIPSKQQHTRLEIFYYWYFNEKLKLFKSSYKLFITKPRLMKSSHNLIFRTIHLLEFLNNYILVFFLFPLTEQFIISVDILTAIWSSCNLPWKTSLQLQANILFNDRILTENCDLEVCKNK